MPQGGRTMIRVGVLLLSLLFAVGARAAPIENSDGFWSEWSDATSARCGAERGRILATGLTDAQRDEILGFIDKAWDDEHGGWSKSKFVDGPMLAWALQRARGGDRENEARIRKVLTLMADTMIDKNVGAMSQVNLQP